jgi:hypothetical protein
VTLARQQGRCRCHHGGGGRAPGSTLPAAREDVLSAGKQTRSGRRNKIWHCLATRVHSAARKDHCAGAALFGRLRWSIKRDLHPPWPCLSLSRLVCIDMGLDSRAKRGSWSFGGKSNPAAVAVDVPCTQSRACMPQLPPFFVWLRFDSSNSTAVSDRSIDRWLISRGRPPSVSPTAEP